MADNFLNFKNGIWEVANRRELLTHFAPKLFDETINRLKESAIKVFSEIDPSLELEPSDRFAANIYGKTPKYSVQIKSGLANALAFLATYPEKFVNCTDGLVEGVANSFVRELFNEPDWRTWASLNDYLPLIAETSPTELMAAVEQEFNAKSGEAFKTLFAQEGSGVTGKNYLTGLLWALETIAWNEKHLIRTSMCLAELARIDSGGNWANRPIHSLTSIYLPWYPQTLAPIDKRVIAVQTLNSEIPSVGWELIKSLLPNQTQMSSGSRKPKWRQWVPDEWEDGKIIRKDFWGQVDEYSKQLVEIVKADNSKISELIYLIPNLTDEPRGQFLDGLRNVNSLELKEGERVEIWDDLLKLVNSHQRHSDADWSLDQKTVSELAEIATNLTPKEPFLHHQRLFQEDEFDLYEDDGDWQKQGQLIKEKRQSAVHEIFEKGGLRELLSFNLEVESHWHVGYYLSKCVDNSIDSVILPGLLNEKNDHAVLEFLHGLITGRFEADSWEWVDVLGISEWQVKQKAHLLRLLPFDQTWNRVDEILGEDESLYWEKVNFNPYQQINDVHAIAAKLIEHNRPKSAAFVFRSRINDEEKIDEELVLESLLNIVELDEPIVRNDTYSFTKLIQYLQESSTTNQDKLMKVEWAYLGILDKHHGAEPKLLRKRLAADPDFFCEIIQFMYRSRTKAEEDKNELTDDNKKIIAENSYRLLNDWDRVPGMQDDNSFESLEFVAWLAHVEETCAESGHLEVAHSHIGKVLVSSPKDPDGLFIHQAIADVLNRKDAETLRNGYEIGVHNSRGVHWVDPSGQAEMDLAAKYETQAEEIEEAGFFRLSQSLRNLSESHKRESKRVVAEHAREVASDGE